MLSADSALESSALVARLMGASAEKKSKEMMENLIEGDRIALKACALKAPG